MLLLAQMSSQAWSGSAVAWFVLFLVALAIFIWFLYWLLFPGTSPMPVSDSLHGLDEMSEVMAGRLAKFGIRSDVDLIRLTPRGQQELESQLGLHHGEYDLWRQQILDRWRARFLPEPFRDIPDITPDPELGGIYTRRPRETDDLSKLDGVDKNLANRLNHVGIYTFEQLRLMTAEQKACFKTRFNLAGFEFDSVPDFGVTAQWLAFMGDKPDLPKSDQHKASAATTTHADADEADDSARTRSPSTNATSSVATRNHSSNLPANEIPKSQFDANLGRIYSCPPPHQDDLTKLHGISEDTAKELNAAGIYTLDQVLSLSPAQRIHFKQRFRLPNFEFKHSIFALRQQSAADSRRSSQRQMEEALRPETPYSSSDELAQPEYVFAENSGAEKQPIPTATEQPNVVTGFTVGAASTPTNLSAKQAPATTILAGEVLQDPELGTRFLSPPAKVDDLTRLPGVDGQTARRLNEGGFYTFRQIGDLTLPQQITFETTYGLEDVDFALWRRLIYGWSHGLSAESDLVVRGSGQIGWLHSVRLPVAAQGVFDGQQLVAYPEQVIFRGTEPEAWGQAVSAPRPGVDKSLHHDQIREDINYVRIRRLDTRDSVVVPISRSQLFSPGPDSGGGWNGVCERYFGARHLGAFAPGIVSKVETKFGFGGWGFGHEVDRNDSQVCSWYGRLIPDTKFEISVGRVGESVGTLIFRSSDPAIWNRSVTEGRDRLGKPIGSVTHPISFVRLLRTDTGQGVILGLDAEGLNRQSADSQLGWNGLNEQSCGGYHLGIIAANVPKDVEIAAGKGGWGFGHRQSDRHQQAYGWAGKPIRETVFEISVLESLPDYLRHELIV